jgi:galactose oxidase
MFCPGTSTLADGRILITGGLSDRRASIYDYRNDSFSRTADMNIGRGYQSQLTLSNGDVFTLGGSWSGGTGNKLGEVYTESTTRKWTTKPGINAAGDILTDDFQGVYRSDNHMWLFEATDGRIFHAGPARRMHWINLAGTGSVTQSV